jgi:hypothetical protein
MTWRGGWYVLCAAAVAAAFLRTGCFLGPDVPDASSDAMCSKALPDCGTVPSYDANIAPLVTSVCLPCHAAGGVASDRDLTTYANIQKIESTVLSQVYGCLMPPLDAGTAITASQRTELLQWLVCGSPNN